MRTSRIFVALFAPSLLACGAGAASTAGGAGGAGGAVNDGKYHPAKSGVAMSETDACNALSSAQSGDNIKLMCVATTQGCPDLLRAEFTTACLQYDQGTVDGCVAYYAMASSCTDLSSAIQTCAVSPIAGSAPKGCP